MRFNTFISSTADLERCVNAPNLDEVLLEPILLARQGRLSDEQAQELASDARQRGLRPVLVWDILMPERVMSQVCERLKQWNIEAFDAVRVCDPGAAWWVKTNLPDLPLQLIVETGNHNLEALRGWCEVLRGSLERLVLSIELPEYQLIEYCQILPVGCEILGVGQILLFYSPRSLLSPHVSGQEHPEDELYLETTVASEDSGNRPFPTLETVHGTLMFLDKDQFILDQLGELEAAGLQTVRLDLRHLANEGDVAVDVDQICQQIIADPQQLRSQWSRPTRAPFFKVNRTTSIFSRMKSKSKLSQYRQEKGLAEILTGESGKYILFQALQSFERSQVQHLAIPTGEKLDIPQGFEFRDLNDHVIDKCDREQLLITPWIKKAMPGSLLLGLH